MTHGTPLRRLSIQMVWGAFSGTHGRDGLYFLPKNVTMRGSNYLQVLQNHLLPFLGIHEPTHFTLDGAPAHLEWPGNSPDLNPICTNQQLPQFGGAVPGPVWVGSKWMLAFPRVPVTPGTLLHFFNMLSPERPQKGSTQHLQNRSPVFSSPALILPFFVSSFS